MQYNVPQFIDIEDRIVGPLTAKQLGWLALGGVILLILWNFLDFFLFVLVGIFVVLLSVALAFLKPHGMPLFYFVISSVLFLGKPKAYTWKRAPKKLKLEKMKRKKVTKKKIPRKEIKQSDIKKVSQILDK